MKAIMKSMDIYGTEMNFRFDDSKKFKTSIGGFFTMLTYGLIAAMIYLFGKDFFYMTNPKVLTSLDTPDKYPAPCNLTYETLLFPWRLESTKDKSPVDFKGTGIYPTQLHR
jgi:hypothetical protein